MPISHDLLLGLTSLPLQLDEKSLDENIEEFREWLTPRIDSIDEHDEFNQRVSGYKLSCDLLASIDLNEVSPHEAASRISACCISSLSDIPEDKRFVMLLDIINFVFALTGTTDNNIKCQFSPFLRHSLSCPKIFLPSSQKSEKLQLRGIETIQLGQYKLVNLCQHIVALIRRTKANKDEFHDAAHFLLSSYLLCVFDCGNYQRLAAVIESLSDGRRTEPILEVFATYQLRGSAAAISGHGPEARLRRLLSDLGMSMGVEYNENDVIPASIANGVLPLPSGNTKKTRAYDFVIPVRLPHIKRKIFIQSQIYAGDSGSVSHMNVDQIPLSRQHVRETFNDPIFLEYLDGAGYYTALAGDLKRILQMSDTQGFFQGRSAIFVLPKVFRHIGLLFPADLIGWFAKLRLTGNPLHQSFESFLLERYPPEEVHRVALASIDYGFDLSDPSLEYVQPNMLMISCALVLVDILALLSNLNYENDIRIPGVPGTGVKGETLEEVLFLFEPLVGRDLLQLSLVYLVEGIGAIKYLSI
jgi:hypothetical protein